MKILNRAFLSVKPLKPFLDWANSLDSEISFDENDELEATTYLIEEDFIEIEPVIERNYRKILVHELYCITEDEDLWPEAMNYQLFRTWFDIDFGTIVVDLEKSDLVSDDFDDEDEEQG